MRVDAGGLWRAEARAEDYFVTQPPSMEIIWPVM